MRSVHTAVALMLLFAGCRAEVAEPQVSAGIRALDAGDAAAALTHFAAAELEFPDSAVIAMDRAVALEKLKRHEEALASFARALALDDGTRAARLRYDLGTVKARAGRSGEAVKDLRISLRLNPSDEQARHNLELLLLGRMAARATSASGMSDRLGLGHPDIRLDDRVVLRARIAPDPRVDRLERYWVGHVFDHFDGREWTNQGATRAVADEVALGASSASPEYQSVELLGGYASTTLVGLESPVRFGNASAASGKKLELIEREGDEVAAAPGEAPLRYQVESGVGSTDGGLADEARWRALPELDPRVGALASIVLSGERDPAAAGAKLVSFLRRDYRYTLEGADPWATDPLAEFLFVRRAGHCEEFATAIAVMLRTQGFASRAVTGFSGGTRVANHYELRASQAHAWAQVFSPGRGWLTLDPTPEGLNRQPPERKSQALTKQQAHGLLDRLAEPAKRVLNWPAHDGGTQQDW